MEYIVHFCYHNNGDDSGATMTLDWKITPYVAMIWNVYSERRKIYNLKYLQTIVKTTLTRTENDNEMWQ